MYGPATIRWLPALALFVVIPAAAQVTVASHAFPAESAAVAAETGSADIPVSTSTAVVPAEPLGPEDLGDLYEIRGRYHAAVDAYAKVERPSVDVWNKMGIAYQMLFDATDALRCYKEALKLEPKTPRVLNNIATIYEAQQKYSEAERYYRRALKLDPKNPTFLKNLGTNLLMQHKYKAGAKAYLAALELDPHVFEPHEGPSMDDPAPRGERGTANYFTAASCAQAGLRDCALSHLRKAINEGAATRKRIASDHAFDALRDTPGLMKLLTLTDD